MSNGNSPSPVVAPLTHHLIPSAAAPAKIVLASGRTYSVGTGASQEVNEFDSLHLQANGWMFLAESGPTAMRPTGTTGLYPLVVGAKFWDTTLSHMVMWTGSKWVSESGASA